MDGCASVEHRARGVDLERVAAAPRQRRRLSLRPILARRLFFRPGRFSFSNLWRRTEGGCIGLPGNLAGASTRTRMGKGGARGNDDHRARRATLCLSRQAGRGTALIRMTDPAQVALQDRVRAAAAATQPLFIVGGGTKSFYGEPCV